MQAYDLIMLIVLGMSTIFGAIKGLAWQVASLTSIVVSYIVSYRYRFQVAEMIEAKPPWNMFLAMLILFVGTSFVIWVGFKLMSGMIDRVRLKDFDRHLGAVFGFGKGLIFCLLITMFAMTLLGPSQQSAICESRSGYYIARTLGNGIGILPTELREVVGPYLAKLDQQLKQHDHPHQDSTGGNWTDSLNSNGQPNMNFPSTNAPAGYPTSYPSASYANSGATNANPANSGGFPGSNYPNVNPPAPTFPASPPGNMPGGNQPNFNGSGFDPSIFNPASGYQGMGSNQGMLPGGLRPTGNVDQQAQQPGGIYPR